ncbi:hypothetical protein [Methyloglobulus sp.]|uniref:hypothetical protein n=1 Tax=Methyloglobulus sp. TaxID=2518622 RepID=UPI0032B741C3
MKNSYIAISAPPDTRIEIDKRAAYHQAGHAAAIYLGNKQKQLPAVHFQIVIKPQPQSDRFTHNHGKYTAKVEGGRLIQSLPMSFAEATQYFSWPEQEECLCAFEADVINLLAGALAEAKYVASRDNEVFNPNLVYLGALKFYGGSSDLEVIAEYLECFMLHKAERDRKLAELFLAAFSFVNKQSNWFSINALAEFILAAHKAQSKDIIQCEEVISLLEASRLAA